MVSSIAHIKICPEDYNILTSIMIRAFNEDTRMHTDLDQDGPNGYSDGSLIKALDTNKDFINYKLIYENSIIGAYTVGIRNDREYSLEMIYIDPLYRGKHFGSLVWAGIEQKFDDAELWTVETPSYSTRNYYFYVNKCGFTYKRERVNANGEKSLVFEKRKTLK